MNHANCGTGPALHEFPNYTRQTVAPLNFRAAPMLPSLARMIPCLGEVPSVVFPFPGTILLLR
jgi:hypothetical protein